MATYTGILVLSPAAVEIADKACNAIVNGTVTLPMTKTVDDSAPAVNADYTDNFPREMPEVARTGVKAPGFVDDYYYRFWVYPTTITEYVMTDVVTSVLIWNAFFETATCTSQAVTNSTEITVDLPTGEPPFTLNALQFKTFNVTIPEDGAAQFTSTITWDFGTLGEATLPVTGIRLVVFGLVPTLGLVETLKYKTDVLVAVSTAEQRMSLLSAPRQSFQETLFLEDEDEQTCIDALLFTQHKRAWGLPVWMQYARIDSDIPLGSTVLSFDTSYADYRDDGLAIIWQNSTTYEVVNVLSVATAGLTLSSGTLNAWTGPVYVMPLRVAYMNTQVSRPAAPDGYGSLTATFMMIDNINIDGYVVPLSHQGLPVLTKPSYVEELQEVSMDSDAIITDYESSAFDVFSNSDLPRVVQSHVFKTSSRAEAWDLRQFFDYVRGRQGAFYVPTFKADMVQTSTLAAAGVAFNVQYAGLAANMGVNTLRTDIAFVFPDGTIIPRTIVGLVENGSEETVTISAAPDVTINPGDCEVCFLDKCRLTSDEVDITWEEPDYATCTINLTRVTA